MKTISDHIQDLSDIKKMMEKSSKFISLSGISGISAGIIALIGSMIAFYYLDYDDRYFSVDIYFLEKIFVRSYATYYRLLFLGAILLISAVGLGIFFTTRKARAKGLPIWDNTVKRMLINLAVPLASGGIFCFILYYHKIIYLIAPCTLLFYGLSLLNASKYTYPEVRLLGISEIILGLISSILIGYGLIFWAVGFGILHIVYGIVMYLKYER